MNTVTKINISSVMGIREAIEQIFTLIHRHLDSYVADTDDTRQIEECRYYMHQLNGMLEMLELGGVAFVGNSLEELLIALQEKRIESDAQTLTTVRQAIRSIYRYLDALIDGETDNPIKLFPIYQKIMQIQGLEEISESDLFFPDVRESFPLQPVELDLDTAARQEIAKQARMQFQSGLLGWLKDTDDKSSLQKMIEAVRSIEKLPASIEQRKFWWLSSGFLDSLLHQEQVVDKSVRRLCGKIEQEIRHLDKESHVIAARLTRELLYRIAHSQPVSERLQEINRVYDWQIPLSTIDQQAHLDASIMDEEATASDLQGMRVLLEDINDQWRKFNVEDQENLTSLLALTEQFKALISRVNCPPLEKLAGVIHGALSYLRIRPQSMNEGIALDIASSLLLMENAIDNFYQLSPEFPSQVDALATRIRAVTTGKGSTADLPDLPNPDQAGHLTQEKKLLKQVAQEILTNLAQVEDILDRFFFEPEIRSDLVLLPELFNQISGVLQVLELDQASTVLNSCRILTEKLTQPDQPIDQSEQLLLVDALSSLGFYIEALRNSQSDAEEMLDPIIQRLDQEITGQALATDILEVATGMTTEAASIPLEIPAAAATSQPYDPELLAIFLDESKEVLANIANHLESCTTNYFDQSALTAIRRGFHTLKGSGRMVKLEALSEVAWRVEQLMNRWLSEQKPATGALLDLLTESHRQFSNWCASLRRDGTVEIKADSLLNQIKALMYGADEQLDTSAAAAPVVVEQPSEIPQQEIAATPSVPDIETESTISVGDYQVPTDLFNIFVAEANTHIATLKRVSSLPEEADELSIPHESMLAAHTLASTSRALKLDFIAQISQILEQWFNRLMAEPNTSGQPVLSHLKTAITLLDSMLSAVQAHQLPAAEIMQAGREITDELTHLLEKIPAAQSVEMGEETAPVMATGEIELPELTTSESQEADWSVPVPEASTALPASSLEQVKAAFADLDRELLEVFLEEAGELQSEIGTGLRVWRQHPDQLNVRKAVLRALHTLKGSARIAGAQQISEQAHQMESAIESLHDQAISNALLDQLEIQFDTIVDAIEQLRASLQSETPFIPATPETEAHPEQYFSPTAETITATSVSTVDTEAPRKTTLRVDAELIDRLINESGEASIIRSQVEAQLYDLEKSFQDLSESVDRMRGQLREIELLAETQIPSGTLPSIAHQADFDPLELDHFTRFQELTRLMAESMDDIVTTHKNLREIQRAAAAAVDQQAHLNRRLQQDLLRLRTVPFSHYAERFYRTVRQAAKDTGKQADLVIQGNSIELDRDVLDKISAPLEHLLRNALVHGIETPAERIKAGKAETGRITLDLHQESNEIIMVLQDDGVGLDLERIREKAQQLGMENPENEADDKQWYSLIFTHGFSTVEDVSDIAGRGVGLDIVRNELNELGGEITVTSEKNQGVSFTLRFPVTLTVTQALMIKAANNTYAIPLTAVTHVLEMNAETLRTAYQEHFLTWNNDRFPLGYLPHLLDVSHTFPEIRRSNRIVLLQAGEERLAIHTDALLGQCEVVVKPVGAQLANAPGIEGATITGDGSIVLIINPLKLLQRESVRELLSAGPMAAGGGVDIAPSATAPIVMIVDDSLTVRKVTSRLLERQGYEILIAKDGVGALQLLRETIPAIMLVDIEMPHMDGFELIRAVRNNPELQNIPIIIISSRTAEKHRKVAEELGVNEFMGKPYQEDELLQHIERLIKH